MDCIGDFVTLIVLVTLGGSRSGFFFFLESSEKVGRRGGCSSREMGREVTSDKREYNFVSIRKLLLLLKVV